MSKRDERKQARAQSSGLGAQLAKELTLPKRADATAKAALRTEVDQDRIATLNHIRSREEETAADLLFSYLHRAGRGHQFNEDDNEQIGSIVRSIVEAASAQAQALILAELKKFAEEKH